MSESTMTIDELGNKFWKNSLDQFHRIDGPAVEYCDGQKEWVQNNQWHRIDGPAIEWADGTTIWYIGGDHLGSDIDGFWKHWDRLDEMQRQNVNLHMWLRKLTNV